MRVACTRLAVVVAFVASALAPTHQSKADGPSPDSGRLFEILVGLQNEPGVSFAGGMTESWGRGGRGRRAAYPVGDKLTDPQGEGTPHVRQYEHGGRPSSLAA